MSQEDIKPVDKAPEPAPEPESKTHKGSRWEVFFPSSYSGPRLRIYVASFPPIIYFWPAMLAFLICGTLQAIGVNPTPLGWITIAVFSFNILVIVQDFDQKKFAILILTVAVLGLGAWIVNMYGFTFLKNTVRAFFELNPTFSTSTYLIIGFAFLFFFLWGMIRPLFDYWTFEHNEFVHYVQPFGRDISVPRQNATVTKHIPDVLEFLFTFGGGALIIKRDGEVTATIPHIPFLGRRMRAIERMLSETRVTTINE